MADIVAFLAERLDEDEAVARRVESSWRQVGKTGVIVASDGVHGEECANGNWVGVAEHIVRWDPARVLGEIATKRRALARHRDYDFPYNPDDGPGDYAWTPSCDRCHEPWPCAELLDLAAPYAGHADYAEAWTAPPESAR